LCSPLLDNLQNPLLFKNPNLFPQNQIPTNRGTFPPRKKSSRNPKKTGGKPPQPGGKSPHLSKNKFQLQKERKIKKALKKRGNPNPQGKKSPKTLSPTQKVNKVGTPTFNMGEYLSPNREGQKKGSIKKRDAPLNYTDRVVWCHWSIT